MQQQIESEYIRQSLIGSKNRAELFLDGERLLFTDLSKQLWPAAGHAPAITKRQYISQICMLAPLILPQLAGRPLSVRRLPHGFGRRSFCQRHWATPLPEFIKAIFLPAAGASGGVSDYLLCENLLTLLFLVEKESLEFRTFTACARDVRAAAQFADWSAFNYPDQIVFVLTASPAEDDVEIQYARVCEVALLLKDALAEVGAEAFVRLFKENALHVVVPIIPNLPYEVARRAASIMARGLVARYPNLATLKRAIGQREGKVFIDVSSNSRARTVSCTYSPRPTKSALVCVPVDWEVLAEIDPADYSLHTIGRWVSDVAAPWSQFEHARFDFRTLAKTA